MTTVSMNLVKRLIPNRIKQEAKYFLYDLLKQPYNRFQVPLNIVKWLPNNKPITFIDIGASVGTFSSSINKFYNVKKGVLIEPISSLIPALNEKFPDQQKFEILNIAVSSSTGKSEFYLTDQFNVMSSLLQIKEEFFDPFVITSGGQKIIVKTETLDDVTNRSHLNIIDLIKIDVQGAEHLVLNSGSETLKKTKLVYTEFSYKPIYEGSSTFFDLYKIFTENDFRFVGASDACRINGELIQSDGLFINNKLCP